MMLELLIAIIVLAIGMGGLLVLLVSAMYTNTRAGNDTSSMMLAEHVLEQISSPMAEDDGSLSINDCAQTAWTITTAGAVKGGGTGANGGNGAALIAAAGTPADGTIDWTQSYASVPDGYKMQYVACGAGGQQITYDVRWNVIAMSDYSRMIFASARPSGGGLGGLRFVMPVTLRTIGGM
jgi:type II secretory pathway pseudopilin PulG